MLNLLKPVLTEEAIKANEKVLRSGWTGLGPETRKFEEEFSDYIGVKYGVGLNSCTAALHLALKLIGINPSDEIITTPITFISTNTVILYERAIPVFVDVEPDTLNINPKEIERKVNNRTKAIMCVHYRGHPCDMDEINRIAAENSLFVIEDCAHAAGAEYKEKKVGLGGNLCCWSFHAVKNVPCGGDGGMLTTDNESFANRAKRLRWLGIDKDTYTRTEEIGGKWYAWKYEISEIGYKYHMNDHAASIGREQLKVLDSSNQRRKFIANIYKEELSGVHGITLLKDKDYAKSSNHLFVVKAENRNKLFMKFKIKGIAAGMHYVPNHLFPMFRHLNPEVPVAERVWNDIISLPLHLDLTNEDVFRVCKIIKEGW
jgi:perosamine synthetase